MNAQHTPGPWAEVQRTVWVHQSGAEVQRVAGRSRDYFIALGVKDANDNERKFHSLERAQAAAIAKATGSAA